MVPRVFEDLLPLYLSLEKEYTDIYRLHSRSLQSRYMGRNLHKFNGNSVVEFKKNSLPPLLPAAEELYDAMYAAKLQKKQEIESVKSGILL